MIEKIYAKGRSKIDALNASRDIFQADNPMVHSSSMRKQNIDRFKDHHHLEHEKLLMELHYNSQSALLYTLQPEVRSMTVIVRLVAK